MDTQKRNGEHRCNQTRSVKGHIFLEQNGVCHWFTNGLLTESGGEGILDCKTNFFLTSCQQLCVHQYKSADNCVINIVLNFVCQEKCIVNFLVFTILFMILFSSLIKVGVKYLT